MLVDTRPYLSQLVEMYKAIFSFFDQVIKGMGQIMLKESILTGVLVTIGVFVGGWRTFLATLAAAAAGTLTARLFGFDRKKIDSGLYGFSAALVGAAIGLLFDLTPTTWIAVILGGAAAALVQHIFLRKELPGYTFPFILVTWATVFVLRNFAQVPGPNLFLGKHDALALGNAFAVTNGFGEVTFQKNVFSGIFIFIGVLAADIRAALYGFTASLAGALIAQASGQAADAVTLGLFGFNPVLTAIALSGPTKRDLLFCIIGVIITIGVNLAFANTEIFDAVGGAFTFPFVLATWITSLIKKTSAKQQ